MADEEVNATPEDSPEDNPQEEPAAPVLVAADPAGIGRNVIAVNIEDEMRTSFLNYSMAVIISRALPDVRDGLKPVQRRIFMAMHDLNLTPGAQHRKSAKIAGDTSGNYHPHGEAVVYPTMVRMAQTFSLRYPLVDGQGNFGSVDGDPPAAMRYTEARMSAFGVQLLADLDKDTVDWTDNYDATRQEPIVLPAGFPNFLCNGGEGIAVGMATKVPPHNLREVVDALVRLIDQPEATISEIMEHIKGPDFPTAGLILGTKGIRDAYETGRGTVTMQAKTSIEYIESGRSEIVVTELPYQVNKKRLIELIADLVKQKKLEGIADINDYTDRTGMRVVITLKRDAYPKKVLNFLLKHTPLRMNFGVNMLALVSNQPRILNLKDALVHYIEHRREVVRRRTLFDLNKAKASAHLLEGLQIAIDVLDDIIALIRASRTPEAARTEMMARYALSMLQADYILAMQLRRLTAVEREKLETDYKDLLKQIAYLEDILSSAVRVNQIIKQELKQLRDKFGDERRTRIIPMEAEEIGEEDMIPEEDMIISITRDGYIKRVPKDTYPTQRRGGRGRIGATTKEEDSIEHLFIATTHDFILFFTDRGRVYRLKAYEVPQTSRQAMGTAVINLINIVPDEKITAIVPMRDYKGVEGYLLFATECGEVKRTAISGFANLRANGLICFDIEANDALKWVAHTSGKDEIVLVTRKGMSIRFPETTVPSRGRAAGGVRGIRLSEAKEDRVVGMGVVSATDTTSDLLVIGEFGKGKRTPLRDYRGQGRGGKGIQTMRLSAATGDLVDAQVVTSEDRLLIMTKNGVTIHINVGDIRSIGRSTQGVRLINLEEGDSVSTVERMTEDVKEPEETKG
jgi:DNA gyrase subunit A